MLFLIDLSATMLYFYTVNALCFGAKIFNFKEVVFRGMIASSIGIILFFILTNSTASLICVLATLSMCLLTGLKFLAFISILLLLWSIINDKFITFIASALINFSPTIFYNLKGSLLSFSSLISAWSAHLQPLLWTFLLILIVLKVP